MNLKHTILNSSVPLLFFEQVPPAADKSEAADATLAELEKVRPLADAINVPEIRDEGRQGERTYKFVPRVEPRVLGARIAKELNSEVVINRVVVHEADQLSWFRRTWEEFGIQNVVLVGGESREVRYPGPSVAQAAEMVRSAQLPICLGGITIPSRIHEADRIRVKHAAGLDFFTTQILFDSNDIVWLIQQLNGLSARIFLSFAPVSHPGDLRFLRWLGTDIPQELDRFLLQSDKGAPAAAETCFERSLSLAQRTLMDVFDNLPPDPPPLGLNIEHINQRNYKSAVKMLETLGNLFVSLVAARTRSSFAST
jgi:5,10-methylenetetrahydrofolate reductase